MLPGTTVSASVSTVRAAGIVHGGRLRGRGDGDVDVVWFCVLHAIVFFVFWKEGKAMI
jgi:hypothetical protein